MFAVIETGGKQYKVQYGDVIYVEKLTANEDETVQFPVIAVCDENGTKIGAPYVEGASVTGKVLKNGRRRRLRSLPTSRRRARSARWATDSPTRRFRLRPFRAELNDSR